MLLDLKHPLRFAEQMKPRKHMIDDALERFERVLSSVEGV